MNSGNIVADEISRFSGGPARAATDRFFPREIVAGRVFQLGGFIDLDGMVSWAPALPERVQPVSCYLVRENKQQAYMVDTGVGLHRAAVVSQLRSVLPDDVSLRVIFTRAEFECVGNLGGIHYARGVDEVIAAAFRNPFDAFDEVSRGIDAPSRRQTLEHGGPGTPITALSGSESMMMIPPMLRLLATYWAYDKASKVLFSSDIFSHTDVDRRSPKTVITLADDETTYESARAHVLEKYYWLRRARTQLFSAWLERLFSDFEIDAVAPTHGCVLLGRDVIDKHLGYLLRILKEVGL